MKPLRSFHEPSHRLCWAWLLCALAVWLASVRAAEAGIVYGRVSGGEGHFQTRQSELTIRNANNEIVQRVKTDEQSNYSVGLAPGEYRVEFQHGDKLWIASIQSAESPIRQDIRLRRKD